MWKSVLPYGSAFRSNKYHVSVFRRSIAAAASATDVRAQLLAGLKAAMKNKDTVTSTTIRSVLSEVYAADKARPEPASSSAIVSILRKAALRRVGPVRALASSPQTSASADTAPQTDSAAEYEKASRLDLAEKERREADLLQAFVPPLLPEADIDRVLRQVISEQNMPAGEGNSRKALGVVFKAFYAKVDRSSVDGDLVRARTEALLAEAGPSN